jgi:biopolymer transport protein ExbD
MSKYLFVMLVSFSVFILSSSILNAEGPIDINLNEKNTGIILNKGNSGEIYGGSRGDNVNDKNEWLTLKAGQGGIRIVAHDNMKELIAIDNFGGIYLYGDLFLNNNKLNSKIENIVQKETLNNSILLIIAISLIVNFFLLFFILKLRKEMNIIKVRLTFNK